jgi:hypothetical protein
MPRYVDHHPTDTRMPPEIVTLMRQHLRGNAPNEFGDRCINVFIGTRLTYCYSEAPSLDIVRRSHEAVGIHLGPEDIDEVQVLP